MELIRNSNKNKISTSIIHPVSWCSFFIKKRVVNKSPFDNTLTDEMGYNKEQDAFIKAFKKSETIDKKALYLYFIKENTTHSDIKGHMPFNQPFGFIYAANQSITELTRTMAHELGHGAFRLKHTFSKENKFVQNELKSLILLKKIKRDCLFRQPLLF